MLAFLLRLRNRERLDFGWVFLGLCQLVVLLAELQRRAGRQPGWAPVPAQDARPGLPPSVAKLEVRGSWCSPGVCGSDFSTALEGGALIKLFQRPGTAPGTRGPGMLGMRGPGMLGMQPWPQQNPEAVTTG